MAPASSKEFLEIQANYKVWIHSESRTWHDNNMQPHYLQRNSAELFLYDRNIDLLWVQLQKIQIKVLLFNVH